MSIEYYIAVNKDRIPAIDVVNVAARDMNLPIEVPSSFADLSNYGFKPVRFAGHDSGIEIGLSAADLVRGDYPTFDEVLADRYDSVLTLAWGSDARQGAVAMAICALFCRTSDAVTYSTDEDRLLNEGELTASMRELEAFAVQSGAMR